MEVESVMVTGANRGVGLTFVQQLLKFPNPPLFVFATYRDENSIQALKEIRDSSKDTQVVLIKMDVTKEDEIADARSIVQKKVGDKGLSLLINNAGARIKQKFPEITKENMLFHFSVNTMGPVLVLKQMLSLLQKSAAKASGTNGIRAMVLNISSGGGSIGKFYEPSFEAMGYRISKAALNMAMRIVAFTTKDQDILVMNMCPGLVKTDMGANIKEEPSVSVSAMLMTLSQLNKSHHGAFLDRYGKPIPF